MKNTAKGCLKNCGDVCTLRSGTKKTGAFFGERPNGAKASHYFVTADGAVAFASELKALKVLAKRLSFPLKIRGSVHI